MAEVFEAFLPTALAQYVIHCNLRACMRDLVYCHEYVDSTEAALHALIVARGKEEDSQPWGSMS